MPNKWANYLPFALIFVTLNSASADPEGWLLEKPS